MYPCLKVLVEVKTKILIKTVWTGEYIIDYANIFLSLIFFSLVLKKECNRKHKIERNSAKYTGIFIFYFIFVTNYDLSLGDYFHFYSDMSYTV